jgi:hypothetical protein
MNPAARTGRIHERTRPTPEAVFFLAPRGPSIHEALVGDAARGHAQIGKDPSDHDVLIPSGVGSVGAELLLGRWGG